MAWTAPATATTGQVVTAAFWNAQIRDNFLETAAATATTAGDLVYADAANSMGSRVGIGNPGTNLVSTGSAPVWRTTSQSTGDATYTSGGGGASPDTPTAYAALNAPGWGGTSVQVTLETGTQALYIFGCRYAQAVTAGIIVEMAVAISGSSSVAAGSARSIRTESGVANDQHGMSRAHYATGLTAGSNTFTLQALGTSATVVCGIGSPYLIVMAL